jgi:hypothetical protein
LEGRISKLPLDKENKLKEGSWEAYQKKEWTLCVFFWGKKEDNEYVRGELILMCERMLFIKKKVCKQRAWKEVVCNK